MKKPYSFKNAIHFLRKGIALSLLILLSATTHSNSIDKNTARKTGGDFLLEKPAIPLPNSKREDIYSYAENKALSSKTETVALAGRSDNEAQLPPPPQVGDGYEPNNTPETATPLTVTFNTNHTSIINILNVNCHINADVDYYKINLDAGFSYTVSARLYDRNNDEHHYILYAKIFSSTNGSDWSAGAYSHRPLPNMTIQGGTLYFKIQPSYLSSSDLSSIGSTGTYAARIDIKKIGSTGCTHVFSPVSGELTSAAATSQISVTTASSCFWRASSNENWITLISAQSATGSGTVVYSWTANTEWVSRTGTLTIAGQLYTVTQLPPSITLDDYEGTNGNNTPAEARLLTPEFTANAATLSISAANCHHAADVDFYKINLDAGNHYTVNATLHDKDNQSAGSSYTLNAKISYSTDGSTWSPNNPEDRYLPNMIIKGGKTLYFKIEPWSQGRVGTYAATINLSRAAGCTYVFSPASKVATSQAGIGQITVTASSFCTSSRTATVASDGGWLTLTSGHSATTGSEEVGYSYPKNELLTSRVGTITIGNETYTVTQLPPPLPPDSYEGNNGNNTPAQAHAFTPVFTQNASTVSISPANCHLGTDIDFYKINLPAGYSYSFSGEIYDRSSVHRNHTLYVNSYYSTDGSNWTPVGHNRQLSGRAVTGGTLYLKIEPATAGYTGTYAARIDLKIETSVACINELPVTRVEVAAKEGLNQQAELRVTGQSCAWTATSNANWIALTSGSGTGAGNAGYTYKANGALASRTGTITIAGLTYTISQAGSPLGADSYEGDNGNNTPAEARLLTPEFTANAATLSISAANCHHAADVDFYKINLDVGYIYTVSGVLYDTENNPANNNNYTLNVKSYYSTDATTAVSAWENWEDWWRGIGQLKNQTVQGTLYFKIQPYSSYSSYYDPWITGSYGAKIEVKKVGTVGCTYTLPITSGVVTGEAGVDQQVAMTTSSSGALGCVWAATSNAPWITLTSGHGTGSGQVVYSYKANTTGASRTGTISIADKTYTVTQGIQPDGYEANNTLAQAWSFTPVVITENESTVSISEANCHSTTDVDYYKIILDDRYSYTVSGTLYDQINSSYTLNAKISYSGDGSVWSREQARQLPGMTVPGGILYLKIEPSSVGSMGSYEASIEIKKAAKVGCTYTLSASGKEVSSVAGSHQENVTTGESCLWTATSNVDWITFTSGQSSTGSGTVGYTYNANTEWALRTGTISIAGRTYTVTQLLPSLQPDRYEENNGNNTPAQAYPFTPVFTQNASTLFVSAANCHTVDDVDIYKINLAVGYRYTISGGLYDKNGWWTSNGYTLDAKISYSTDGSNWSDWGLGSVRGWGSQLVSSEVHGSETLYLKIVPKQAGRTGTYAANINLSRIAGCTHSFEPKSKEATSAAGSGQITVTASSSCTSSWGATTNATWITLTPRTTGSGFIDYTYEANTELASREGTITIDDQSFKVTQLPPSLQPDSYEGINGNNTLAQAYPFTPVFTENASTVSISPANCHQVDDIDFYKINLEIGYFYTVNLAVKDALNDGSNHTLDAKVFYSTDGSDWSNEIGADFSPGLVQGGNFYIKIEPRVKGRVGTYAATINISITGGCSTSLPVTSRSVGTPQGTGTIEVTKGSLCRWTATSNATWITLTSGQNGTTGSGSVAYSYSENMEGREGTITVDGQTYTLYQAIPACTFMLSTIPANVGAAAGAGSVTVGALRSNCVWSATSNVPWIIVPPRSGGTGPGSVAYTYQENIVAEERKGTLTVAGQTYEVTQAANPACTFTLSPIPANVTAAAGAGSVTVGALRSNCAWSATSNVPWIIAGSGATGPGSLAYTYQENIVAEERKGTLTVAGQTYEVTQAAAPACTFTLSPIPANVGAAAGAGSVTVGALRSNCTWTATSNVPWIIVPAGSGGTGPGSVAYTYQENIMEARKGTLTVAGQTYEVTQAADPACNFTLSPIPANVTAAAGAGSVTVGALRSNCTWTATSNVPWIIVPAGSGGTGPGSVAYTYQENIMEARKGTLTVAGQAYEVTQAADPACNFTLSPIPANVTAAAGAGSVTVGALRSNCTWTATSNVPWIIVPPQSGGTGPGSVAYSYHENIVTESRKGTLTVAGQTYEVNQAADPACNFTLSPIPANVTAAAGAGSVTVGALRSNCTWTATSNVPWIIVPAGSGGTGPGSVAYTYQENIMEARKGTLTVAGQTYEVTQAADPACNFTLSPIPANVTAAAGAGSVTVGALRSNCTWSATSNVPWIIVPVGSGGTGPGSVAYTYGENIGAEARKGTLTVAGQAYEVTQEAASACTFTLSGLDNVTAAAGTGSVTVTALGSNCAWTAASNVPWIIVPAGSGGTGSGSVGYSYTENTGAISRTGTITVDNQTFTLTQSIVTGIEPAGHVKIFPNPAGDFVTVDLSAGHVKYVSLKIVSQFGQILYELNNPNQTLQIPLKGFAKGLYFIQIQGEEKLWVEKLVIKH